MNFFIGIAISLAFTAVQVMISASAASAKEEAMTRLIDERHALQKQLADEQNTKKRAVLLASARSRRGALANQMVNLGRDAESGFSQGNLTAIQSSLQGALAHLEKTGNLKELIGSASDDLLKEQYAADDPFATFGGAVAGLGSRIGAGVAVGGAEDYFNTPEPSDPFEFPKKL